MLARVIVLPMSASFCRRLFIGNRQWRNKHCERWGRSVPTNNGFDDQSLLKLAGLANGDAKKSNPV